MARDDPDFAIRDLYNAIAQGDYPSYTMYIQVMSFEVSLKKRVLFVTLEPPKYSNSPNLYFDFFNESATNNLRQISG